MQLFRPAYSLRAYQALSALTFSSILADLAFILYWGLRPTDVTGTLMGGGYGQLMYMMAWWVAIGGLGVCSCMRLPGRWLAWGVAGVMQMGIGLWWRLRYPESYELIYIPEDRDITYAIVVGLAITALAVWRGRVSRPIVDSGARGPRSVVALVLMIGFLGVPLRAWLQEPLPYCSFDKAGNQLTMCLGDEPRSYR